MTDDGWVTVDRLNVVHTTPVDDAVGHEDSWCCACVPTVQVCVANGGVSVVHNAWDGRK